MRTAVVLLSGGLDSATTLAIARGRGFESYALSVDYGQRHTAELAAAGQLATAQEVQAQATRMARLIDDLLSLTRIEHFPEPIAEHGWRVVTVNLPPR